MRIRTKSKKSGAAEALKGAMESRGGSVNQWSEIGITLIRTWIRVFVKSVIRIRTKMMRIRSPALAGSRVSFLYFIPSWTYKSPTKKIFLQVFLFITL
jgi:hypothetical protein